MMCVKAVKDGVMKCFTILMEITEMKNSTTIDNVY